MLAMRASLSGNVPPVVQSNFAQSANDFTTVSTLSSMPSGGSITRSGQGMLYDSTGKLTYAPNNLLLQTGFASGWTYIGSSATSGQTAPDGTSTAIKLVEDTSTGQHRFYQSVTPANGVSYIASVYAKPAGRNFIVIEGQTSFGGGYVWFNVSTGVVGTVGGANYSNPTITSVGSGWYRCSVKFAAGSSNSSQIAFYETATDGVSSYTGDGTSGVLFWSPQVEAVTYQTTPSTYVATTSAAYYGPRFDYDPSTLAAKGLLIEGTRTNLANASNQITSATYWTPTSFARNATITGPDGVSGSAQQFLASAGAASHSCYSASTITGLTSGGVYAQSIYAKPVTNANYIWVSFNISAGNYATAVFDLSSATTTASQTSVGSTSGAVYSTSKQNLGNGWYRLTIVASIVSTSAYFEFGVAGAATGNTFNTAGEVTFTAAGTETAAFYGPQLELGAFSTSYIPNPVTVSTGTARAAETFAITGYSSNLINATYIDEQTGVTSVQPYNAGTAPSPSFSWLTSLRAYTNAYAGSISSPSWLSFTRNSNAMMTDSTGKLTYAEANFYQYSTDQSNAYYSQNNLVTAASSTDPNGATANTKFTATAGLSVNVRVGALPSLSIGAGYALYSYYFKAGSGVGYIHSRILDSGTTYGTCINTSTLAFTAGFYDGTTATTAVTSNTVQSIGNGWYRVSIVVPCGSASAQHGMLNYFSNSATTTSNTWAGTEYIYMWGFQLENVTYQTTARSLIVTTNAAIYNPRYDYDASTVPATPRGLLIEEQRANLLKYSNTFSDANWTKARITVATAAITSPDGTANAWTCTEDTTAASTHPFFQSYLSPTVGANYTFSYYAKYGSNRNALISTYDGTNNAYVIYNLQTGAEVTSVGTIVNKSITPVGNGWYKLTLTTTISTGATFITGYIQTANGSVSTYNGDGVSFIYAYGAQLEAGSFATSYIPTTTASVTRNADAAQLTGSALTTLQGNNASLGLEYYYARNGCLWDLEPVAAGTFLTMSAQGVGGTGWYAAGLATMTAPTLNAVNRQFIGWNKTGNFSGSTNNSATVSSSACDYTGSSTSSYLGSRSGGSTPINSYVRSLAIYNQKLPDSILKQKSTVGAPY